MDKDLKRKLRGDLFRHLDGIVTCPTAYALNEGGVLSFILERESTTLVEIAERFKANKGYLNVALRVLASQGWLDYTIDITGVSVSLNDTSSIAFELIPIYKQVSRIDGSIWAFSSSKI